MPKPRIISHPFSGGPLTGKCSISISVTHGRVGNLVTALLSQQRSQDDGQLLKTSKASQIHSRHTLSNEEKITRYQLPSASMRPYIQRSRHRSRMSTWIVQAYGF